MRALADLNIRIEWQSGDRAVRSPELRETFARLEISVGDECVTLVQDLATGSVRRSVAVSVYPLAEWIAFSWWLLQYDGRPYLDGPRRDLAAHSTSFAGDGFCWPDLRIVPEGDLVRLRWQRQTTHAGWPLRMLSGGGALTGRNQAVAALEGCVEAVLERLAEAGITDTALSEEWFNLRSLSAEEADLCRAIARLGLDPFAEGADLVSEIEAIWQIGGEQLAVELLDGTGPGEVPLGRNVRSALGFAVGDRVGGGEGGARHSKPRSHEAVP
ncbi:MAG: hypothetical protein KY450_13270 [Actinobacteria bacterium]|nr:hypothetical protein [Actinomycetota bacterium]